MSLNAAHECKSHVAEELPERTPLNLLPLPMLAAQSLTLKLATLLLLHKLAALLRRCCCADAAEQMLMRRCCCG